MSTDVNWNQILDEQAADVSSGAAPDGPYNVRITSAQAVVASTGSPMIKLVCEVIDGPYKGKAVWSNIVMKADSPGSMRMAVVNLTGLGIEQTWLKTHNPSMAAIAEELKGSEAVAELTSREWQGEMRNDVKKFTRPGTASGTPAAPTIASASPAPSVPQAPSIPTPDAPPAPSVPDTPPAPSIPTPDAAPAASAAPDTSEEPF